MAGPSRRLLLAAAVLGSCLQPAPAQLRIAVTATPPPAPRLGGSVTLALQPPPAAPIPVCTWYRAAKAEAASPAEILTYAQGTGQRNGTSYTGRETGRPDCSLHIAGLLLSDSSPYSLWLPTTGDLVTENVTVFEMLLQPKVMPPSPTVVENSTLELTCEAPPSTEVLLWERDGSVPVPSGRVGLSPGNRTLTVRGVGRDDTGSYTCEVRNPVSAARSKGDIVTVIYGPVAAHISPPGPLHPLLGDNVTLRCAANAFPAPQFHWSHNGSDRVPALTGAVLSLALRGTEQTGMFECRATNPRTGRSATAFVSIGLGQQEGPSLSAGAVAGITLAAVVLAGALACVLFRHCRRKTPRDSKESPPVYENVTPQASVGAVAQPGSSPDPTYQTLQPGTRDLYEELRT